MMGNKKVRSVLLASISLLALGGLAAVPQATEDDPYSIAVVQALPQATTWVFKRRH